MAQTGLEVGLAISSLKARDTKGTNHDEYPTGPLPTVCALGRRRRPPPRLGTWLLKPHDKVNSTLVLHQGKALAAEIW